MDLREQCLPRLVLRVERLRALDVGLLMSLGPSPKEKDQVFAMFCFRRQVCTNRRAVASGRNKVNGESGKAIKA